jgi:hypothetical protein
MPGPSTTDYIVPQISVSVPWCWLETFIAVFLYTGAYSAVNQLLFSMASVKMFHSSASLRCSLLESVYLARSVNIWIALRNMFSLLKSQRLPQQFLSTMENTVPKTCISIPLSYLASSIAVCMYDEMGLYSAIKQHLFSMAFARDRLAQTL